MIIPDISKWQGPIDWVKMKSKCDAVIIKASQKNYMDPMFLANWAGAKAVGLLRAAYHYMDWTDPTNWGGEAQAKFFGDTIAFDPGELPPVLDFEEHQDSTGKIDVIMPLNVLEHLQDALSNLEDRFHRPPMIYTGVGVWNAHTNSGTLKGNDPRWKHYPLWVANWDVTSPAIPVPWTELHAGEQYVYWQYTAKGIAADYGIGPACLQLDLNKFNGTLDNLRTFAGIALPPTVHPSICPTCGQFWPPEVVNNYQVRVGSNLNVYYPTKDDRPSLGLLMAGTKVYIKNYAAIPWYAFFEPITTFPKGGWVYKSYLEKI
jgi:lysozyme